MVCHHLRPKVSEDNNSPERFPDYSVALCWRENLEEMEAEMARQHRAVGRALNCESAALAAMLTLQV